MGNLDGVSAEACDQQQLQYEAFDGRELSSPSFGHKMGSGGSVSSFLEQEQRRQLHQQKFSSPAYTEIRTRKNGFKAAAANGALMSNGFKVK